MCPGPARAAAQDARARGCRRRVAVDVAQELGEARRAAPPAQVRRACGVERRVSVGVERHHDGVAAGPAGRSAALVRRRRWKRRLVEAGDDVRREGVVAEQGDAAARRGRAARPGAAGRQSGPRKSKTPTSRVALVDRGDADAALAGGGEVEVGAAELPGLEHQADDRVRAAGARSSPAVIGRRWPELVRMSQPARSLVVGASP